MTGRPRGRALAASLAMALIGGVAVAAQEEVRPEVRGRVLLGGGPLGGARVVLHHVSTDSAGEIDSLQADGEGRFTLPLPAMPDEGGGTLYFASVRHQGILYFGRAIARPVQLDSLYEIRVWDTVPAPPGGARIPLAVRYVVIDQSADGWTVTELYELEVGQQGTLVPPLEGPTWSHPLPEGARNAEAAGAVDPSGPRVADGRLQVDSPISPGTRQFLVSYTVDALDGLRIPVADPVAEFELLVRQPAPVTSVSGLDPIESVEMEAGVSYLRFAGILPGDTALVISAEPEPRDLPLRELAVALAFVLAIAGLWAVGRARGRQAGAAGAGGGLSSTGSTPSGSVPPGSTPSGRALRGDARDRLLLEIARIDERLGLEGERAPAADERERLTRERADLVARLRGGR